MSGKVRANKLFIGVGDDANEDRKQLSIITSLLDNFNIYLNQYGKIFTVDEIGSFDIKIVNDLAVLEFLPIDGNLNNYNYKFISYNLNKYISETYNYEFGNSLKIISENSPVAAGIPTSILDINNDVVSLKCLIEISSNNVGDNEYEYNELNIIINNNNAYISEYGRITLSDDNNIQNVGFGTYGVSFSGSSPKLIFYPNHPSNLTCNLISVLIFDPKFNGTGKNQIKFADIKSNYVGIASTSIPTPEVITSYDSSYDFGYFIVQIVDNTNNEVQLSEILVTNDTGECYMVQYADVYTSGFLGNFDCSSTSVTKLTFTPNENIDVSVTLLHHSISNISLLSVPSLLDLKNSFITSGVSKYDESSSSNLKKSFELTYKNNPIFRRTFAGNFETNGANLGVDLVRDLIYIPNHFFRSGEQIIYSSNLFAYNTILTTTASQTSSIGSNTVYVNNSSGLIPGDFLNFPDGNRSKVLSLNNNSVSLLNPLTYNVLVGTSVSFSRFSEILEDSLSTDSAIGIGETYIAGVGVTDKLSGDLYLFKFDDNFVGFCTSPIDALTTPPKLIDLVSLGLGENHYITATKQNAKCLIAIDNIIQAPITPTNIKTTLQNNLSITDNILYCSGITSFFSGDLIEIDDEIMRINYALVGTANSLSVERSFLGTGISTHSSGSQIRKLKGNFNIVGNNIHFASAPYGPIYDEINGNINVRSSFQGRVFTRSGIPDTNIETYERNYIFDDLSEQFDSVKSDFKLKEENKDVSGFFDSNAIILVNNVFQSPENDYNLSEESKQTELNFTGTATSALYDVNTSGVPRGGVIVSAGSSNGFGFQPLVSAGGTAVVSISGTIQSISIGNSGSGYRVGVQPIVNVGVQTMSDGIPNIEYIGTATVLDGHVVGVSVTNPGQGYSQNNPPTVVFDAPLSYSNLELIYKDNVGLGSQARVDIVVGQGSSVIDFTIQNYGYSYDVGDVLTIEVGGISGIPTDTSKTYEPFTLTVEEVFYDNFNGWSVGELQKLDDIDYLFDGFRRKFPIIDNDNKFAIIAEEGSVLDLEASLLVFINDVLQKPNSAYVFTGGSNIEFTEAPKAGSKCRILFYRGTPNVDVKDRDILETIKVGDDLRIIGDSLKLKENKRIVTDIILPDILETLPYNSVGISSDETLLRPIKWCKQKDDLILNGTNVSKSRVNYESNIYPYCNIIQPISIGQTQIYVDGIKSIFDANNENTEYDVISVIEIIENTDLIPAIGTAIVSASGTIQSINIINSGYGYLNPPEISIQSPVNNILGIASLSSNISSGSLSNIIVENPGYGYTSTNPPLVLIEEPKRDIEVMRNVNYFGDHGIITGVKETTVGYAQTGLILDLYIPLDSYLRNSLVTDPTIPASTIKENDYLKVSNSSIGSGVTSLRKDGSVIGIGTTGIDNIYQVISVSYASTDVYGYGTQNVAQVVVSISTYSGISGFGYSSYYGDYSWGLIEVEGANKNWNVDNNYGVVGLNSTPVIRRFNRYRTRNYTAS